MKLPHKMKCYAFTLAETMVSIGCGSILLAAVMIASVALQRSFAAVQAYSVSEGDQLRVLDYISMDCRRALTGTITNNTLVLTLPVYYDSSNSYNPVTPTLTSGAISYGSGSVTVTYAQSGSNFNRNVVIKNAAGTVTSDTSTAIATNVASFTVTPQDWTSSMSCNIMFFPTFKYQAGSGTWRSGGSAPDNSVGVDNDLYVVDATATDQTTVGNVYRRLSGAYSLLQNVKATNVDCNTFLRNAGARQ